MENSTSRLLFADWLRAWALLVMIETHVFNAFLAAQFRDSEWFRNLNFLNGMVAPSFLFVSGFVFLVASQKRMEQLRMLGRRASARSCSSGFCSSASSAMVSRAVFAISRTRFPAKVHSYDQSAGLVSLPVFGSR
jgi:hypothetical protein